MEVSFKFNLTRSGIYRNSFLICILSIVYHVQKLRSFSLDILVSLLLNSLEKRCFIKIVKEMLLKCTKDDLLLSNKVIHVYVIHVIDWTAKVLLFLGKIVSMWYKYSTLKVLYKNCIRAGSCLIALN